MLVLQPGPHPGRRGFDSRPGHFAEALGFRPEAGGRARLHSACGLVAEHGEVVKLVDTRRSDRRAPRAWEFESPLRHWQRL